jgi:hypothetical protein
VSPTTPAAVVLLGAQRFDPTLGDAVAEIGVTGRIGTITAGWQERESEDEDLALHLGGRTVNLRLHARGEAVFRADTELRQAHRERQALLRHRREFYRIRLEQELEAERVIRARSATPPELAAEQAQASVDALRALDRAHLASCARSRAEFEHRLALAERPEVARQRRELADLAAGCRAFAIAGGHVATLLNRFALFDVAALLRGKPVFAWSGGAMVISDRVVLFHDHPPQGPGAAEVLEAGLGLVPDVVFLPQPEERLDLAQTERVAGLVRRFAPARCIALPSRSRVAWRGGRFVASDGAVELAADGSHAPFQPAAGVGR